MKKLTISLLAVIFSLGAAFSQPVSDMGIIPVGVTLNSILRLNVTSGGNIEFVINTIDQYQNGIAPSALYETHFTVASSTDFDVALWADAVLWDHDGDGGAVTAEVGAFTGVDNNASPNFMLLGNLGYTISEQGTGVDPANWDLAPLDGTENAEAVTELATPIVIGTVGASAGGVDQNQFTIHWRFGTHEAGSTMEASTLLSQSIPADRYVVNVFLQLQAK